MTATTLTTELRGYHSQQGQLLHALVGGPLDSGAPELMRKLVLEMVRHLVHEEVLLVPLVEERLGAELAQACRDGLGRLDADVRALAGTATSDAGFADALRGLGEDYGAHARWQETELFPPLEHGDTEGHLEGAGAVLDPAVEVGPTSPHPAGFRSSSGEWPAPGLVDELRRDFQTATAQRTGI